MAVSTDQNIIAAVAFSTGAIVAYAMAKWRESTLNQLHERRLKQEVELARREAVAAAAEITADAEAERARARVAAQETEAVRLRTVEERTRAAEELTRARQEAMRLSGLSPEALRRAAVEAMRIDCHEEAQQLRAELVTPAEKEVSEEARKKLLAAMQRLAPQVTQEANAVTVALASDEMKGRLIGREGRNIRTFEQLTGATLLIDETPDAVLVSCFDPVRRETARLALCAVVADGRVSPTLIEACVAQARTEVETSLKKFGREAVRDLGLPPMEAAVEELLGRLHFRLSANQNTLAHSVEVARLCAIMATELGLDPVPAKRAGLLHDLGKALEAETEGSHALAGAALLRRLGEDPRVVNAVAAHHREVPPESPFAPLVMIADSISGSRPGARASSLDGLIRRQRGLESLAMTFPGVLEAYALQAGRELRVIVKPSELSDAGASDLAQRLRKAVEEQLNLPGAVRITVIRETRYTDEAR